MKQIEAAVLDILAQCTTQANKLYLPQIQLDRKLYQAVDKVLGDLGGKWNRKEKAHLFDVDAEELLSEVLLTGTYDAKTDRLKELAFFPTPEAVCEVMHLNLRDDMVVDEILEPSAGTGNIAKFFSKVYPDADITAVEIHPEFINDLAELNIAQVVNNDFLEVLPREYDLVVMNPPYNRTRAEIAHVRHALKFVKTGGQLMAIMPKGIEFRTDSKTKALIEALDSIQGRGGFWEIIDLPEGSFKETGTMVRTVLLNVHFA